MIISHVLGLNAREILFLEDGLILVEGQEDVIFYRLLETKIEKRFEGEFYGWGVGGAEKMEIVAQMLKDLGFQRVAGILDNGKCELMFELKKRFPEFHFFTIPAPDVKLLHVTDKPLTAPKMRRSAVAASFEL